jgi:hypothetical protein
MRCIAYSCPGICLGRLSETVLTGHLAGIGDAKIRIASHATNAPQAAFFDLCSAILRMRRPSWQPQRCKKAAATEKKRAAAHLREIGKRWH